MTLSRANKDVWRCELAPSGAHWYVECVCKFCGKEKEGKNKNGDSFSFDTKGQRTAGDV